jgi:hypothetical protein
MAAFSYDFERSHRGVLCWFFCDVDIVCDTRAMAAMSRVDSIFYTASIA